MDNENMELNGNGELNENSNKENRQKKPRKAVKTILIIFLAIVLLIGIAVGGGLFLINHTLNKMNRVDKSKEQAIPRDMEDFEPDERTQGKEDTMDPDQVEWSDIKAMQDPNVKNILLIGQDRRPGETGRTRSDSMIIVSINKNKNIVTMVSLMRDMYVPIPGYSDNRINAAYAFGGMSLLDEVIKGNFGVVIDGNIEVDFDGFTRAMSKIAPLEIDLKDYEASYLNSWNSGWNLHAGINALNADQLLAYARIRHVGNADYERTERQRRILNAAFAKIKTMSATDIYNLVDSVMPSLTTDMDNGEIMGYVTYYLANRPGMAGDYRLPVDKSFRDEIIRGMMVLVPDLQYNAKMLQLYLYGKTVN